MLAVAGVALLFSFQAFSAVTIANESDHVCCGEHCPVCVELQQCVASFQLTGSGWESEPTWVDECVPEGDYLPAAVVEPSHPTLVSLKIRLDE